LPPGTALLPSPVNSCPQAPTKCMSGGPRRRQGRRTVLRTRSSVLLSRTAPVDASRSVCGARAAGGPARYGKSTRRLTRMNVDGPFDYNLPFSSETDTSYLKG
jgi:hypothetical protein